MEEARRLDALFHMLRRRSNAVRKYSEEILTRALDDCTRIAPLDETPAPETLALFTDFGGTIHVGEAALLALSAEHETYCLASNDKTALRTVATEPALAPLRARVAGRVLCLETVLKALLERIGPEELARRMAPVLRFDLRLHSIFSPAASGKPEDCLNAVASFLAGLNREFGDDFLWAPP